MESFYQHKMDIEAFLKETDNLSKNILTRLKDLIHELTEGHTEGNLFLSPKQESITLHKSLFNISHIYYNKETFKYEAHVENCMNCTPLENFPLEDILQIYSHIYYMDKN